MITKEENCFLHMVLSLLESRYISLSLSLSLSLSCVITPCREHFVLAIKIQFTPNHQMCAKWEPTNVYMLITGLCPMLCYSLNPG